MNTDIAYVGADMVLRITGVKNADGDPQNDASVVVAAIRPKDGGTDILGGPVNGTLVTGSANDYVVPLADSIQLQDGAFYRAEGSITLASGEVLPFRHIFRATHFETPR